MNFKICSRCDKPFDINKAIFRDYFELPICNDCTNKGLKPLGYHSYWGCKCDWCKANKLKCNVCGCNYDKDKKCERDHTKEIQI